MYLYVGGICAHVCACGGRRRISSVLLCHLVETQTGEPSDLAVSIPHGSAVSGMHVAMGAEDLSSGLHSCTVSSLTHRATCQPPSRYCLISRTRYGRSGNPRYGWSRDPTKTRLSVHALTWGGWAFGSQAGRLWAIAPRGKGSQQVKLPREK